MASQYEFKNMERDLSAIEQQLNSFEKTLNSIVESVSSAKFNERDYGDRSIEKKVDGIINDSKKRIDRKYNEFVNGIKRATYDSQERIKCEAKNVSQIVEILNNSILQIINLNDAFVTKKYRQVIDSVDSIDTIYFDDEMRKRILLLKIEAYDALCSQGLSNISFSVFDDCKKYYNLCKSSSAEKHLNNAAGYLLVACSRLLDANIVDNNAQAYRICCVALESYGDLCEKEKIAFDSDYKKCYSIGIKQYNELCEKAYNSFDYISVKGLLKDSSLFFTGDIENDFFKGEENLAEKLFEYFKDRGKNATNDVVDMVFEDTKTLVDSSDNEKYIAYWLTRYDDFGLAYVTKMNEQHNNDLTFFKKSIKAFLDNCKTISKRANCFLDLVNTYNTVLTEHKTAINLYAFLTNAVLWNRCINDLKTYAQQDDENFRQGTKTIDGITYSMVNKYKKLCCGYEESLIQELNVVMDDASLRLHGKRYLNNLYHSREKGTAQSTEVKLFTRETQANNRKKMIVGALIAVALIIVVTLIIVLIK